MQYFTYLTLFKIICLNKVTREEHRPGIGYGLLSDASKGGSYARHKRTFVAARLGGESIATFGATNVRLWRRSKYTSSCEFATQSLQSSHSPNGGLVGAETRDALTAAYTAERGLCAFLSHTNQTLAKKYSLMVCKVKCQNLYYSIDFDDCLRRPGGETFLLKSDINAIFHVFNFSHTSASKAVYAAAHEGPPPEGERSGLAVRVKIICSNKV